MSDFKRSVSNQGHYWTPGVPAHDDHFQFSGDLKIIGYSDEWLSDIAKFEGGFEDLMDGRRVSRAYDDDLRVLGDLKIIGKSDEWLSGVSEEPRIMGNSDERVIIDFAFLVVDDAAIRFILGNSGQGPR